MNKELVKQVKQLAPKFNTGALLDIPTGNFINGQSLNGGLTTLPNIGSNYGRNIGLSIRLIGVAMDDVRKTPPSTPERYAIAVKLFTLMGFGVKQKDSTHEPEVFWTDFEAGSEHTPDMIRDILHKDYSEELAEASKQLRNFRDSLTQTFQALGNCEGNRALKINIDSYSPMR